MNGTPPDSVATENVPGRQDCSTWYERTSQRGYAPGKQLGQTRQCSGLKRTLFARCELPNADQSRMSHNLSYEQTRWSQAGNLHMPMLRALSRMCQQRLVHSMTRIQF